MRYTTVQLHNLKARLILDIYQVSISVWKWRTRRFAWQWFFESLRWWQIGPVEWMIHPVSRAAELPLERNTPIPADRYCPECKALLEDRSVYCDVCGTDTPLP